MGKYAYHLHDRGLHGTGRIMFSATASISAPSVCVLSPSHVACYIAVGRIGNARMAIETRGLQKVTNIGLGTDIQLSGTQYSLNINSGFEAFSSSFNPSGGNPICGTDYSLPSASLGWLLKGPNLHHFNGAPEVRVLLSDLKNHSVRITMS